MRLTLLPEGDSAPLRWTILVCVLGAACAATLSAVHNVFPRGGLTPGAFHSMGGALVPLLSRASQTVVWYAGILSVMALLGRVVGGSVAGASIAAVVATVLIARSNRFILLTAFLMAIAPLCAYLITTKLQGSELWRRLILAGLILGTALPLEAYLLRQWTGFSFTPPEMLEQSGWLPGTVAVGALTLLGVSFLLPGVWRRVAGGGALVGVAAGVALIFLGAGDSGRDGVIAGETTGPRYVIWLSVDTLRADAVEPYAAGRGTPALASLAADSTVFTQAYSPSPWTLPSMTSMITGYSPEVHGVGLAIEDAPLPTLGEMFHDSGFRTGALIGNPILLAGRPLVNARNETRFNFYGGMESWRVFHESRYGNSTGADRLYAEQPAEYFDGGSTVVQTDYIVNWLREGEGEPFFLWAHYYDPHWPLAPPHEYLPEGQDPAPRLGPRILNAPDVRTGVETYSPDEQAWMRALYDAEVRYVDDSIQRVLDELKTLGIYEDALIIFTSDHGEEFWEHHRYGHGHAIYPEVLHVPLFVKLPGNGSTARVERPVSTRSILPTTLDLAKLPADKPDEWAPSLVPFLHEEPSQMPVEPVFASAVELFENQEAVFFDGLQLIRHIDTEGVELYDLEADPGAIRSIAHERPEDVKRGLELLEAHHAQAQERRRKLGLSQDASGEKWDPETIQRLKDLGYL